jgi:hypothetical protein
MRPEPQVLPEPGKLRAQAERRMRPAPQVLPEPEKPRVLPERSLQEGNPGLRLHWQIPGELHFGRYRRLNLTGPTRRMLRHLPEPYHHNQYHQ